MATSERTPRARAARLAAVAFPVVLLLFATLFLRGQIGFWSDDYWHNQRDPVTQALPDLHASGHLSLAPLVIHRGFFLRPLFYVIVPIVTTLAWPVPWAAHLVMVGAHAAVCLLLWRLLRRLGLSPLASSAAALLYMVYPIQFEAVFWVSALPTTLAVVLMLWIFHMHVAIARGRTARWRMPVMTLATFALCCLNEQPAMGVLSMPILYAAALPRGSTRGDPAPQRRPPRSGVRHLLLALLPPLFCGLAVLFYLYLVKRGLPALGIHPVPPGIRGSASTLVRLDQVPARTREFAHSLWPRICMKNFAGGCLKVGLAELRSAGWPTLVWLAALLGSGVLWVVRWSREPARAAGAPGRVMPRTLLTVALGLTIYVIGFVPPTLVAVYLADSRLMYWPSIGLAIAIGAVGTALEGAALRSGKARAAAAGALAFSLLLGGVCYVGIQAAFRNRWRMDRDEGRQLAALVPDPPPYTFFVPLRVDSRAVRTGYPVFDVHHRSVWEFMWTAPKFVKTALHNDLVRCGYWRSWTPNDPVRGGDETGIHYADRLGPAMLEENGERRRAFLPIEGSGSRVPWRRTVPFIVDSDGRVRLITTIIIEAPGKPGVAIPVPQAAHQPKLEWTLPRA
jgi:hypothetical protein